LLAGLTNDYLEKTLSEAAITYSGNSINEQYHAASATRTLLKEGNNFLTPPATVTLQDIRPGVNQAVLGTDIKVGLSYCMQQLLLLFVLIRACLACGAGGHCKATWLASLLYGAAAEAQLAHTMRTPYGISHTSQAALTMACK
jgi:hypothetical protein